MGRHTKPDEIDTHAELFGVKHHVVLLKGETVESSKIIDALVKSLSCSVEYAEDRLREVNEDKESYIYASHYERCELVQGLLNRNNSKLLTKVIKD
jgi:hypothetical protein